MLLSSRPAGVQLLLIHQTPQSQAQERAGGAQMWMPYFWTNRKFLKFNKQLSFSLQLLLTFDDNLNCVNKYFRKLHFQPHVFYLYLAEFFNLWVSREILPFALTGPSSTLPKKGGKSTGSTIKFNFLLPLQRAVHFCLTPPISQFI